MRKSIITLITVLAVIGMLASTAVAQQGTLRHGFGVGWLTFDPHKDQRTISFTYLSPMYEGLLTESMDGQSFEPALATSWEEDTEGVTFNLREGVNFHDGTPFNADAAVANFNRVKAEGHPALKGFLKNAESAEAIDDMTVRYNYSKFDATILLTLARFAGMMVSPAAFPAEGEKVAVPVGTGPWQFNADDTNEDNSLIVVDAYDGWWGGPSDRPARIEFNNFGGNPANISALLAGDLDSTGYGGPPNKMLLDSNGMITTEALSVGWGVLIQDRNGELVPELADVRVRKAMQLAINGAAYAATTDIGQPTNQYGAEGNYGHSENITTSFDMEAAMALMAEAGNPTFDLVMPGGASFSKRNAFVQSAWEPLGITVIEENVGQAIFPSCFSGKFAAAFCPINERELKHHIENRLLEGGSMNPFGVRNEEIEALYERASTQPADVAESFYRIIMEKADEEAYTAWAVWASIPVAYNPENVEGPQLRFFYPGVIRYTDVRMLN